MNSVVQLLEVHFLKGHTYEEKLGLEPDMPDIRGTQSVNKGSGKVTNSYFKQKCYFKSGLSCDCPVKRASFCVCCILFGGNKDGLNGV